MTEQEFTGYLQSIGGLKHGHYANRLIEDDSFFSFEAGWYDITKDLIQDLIMFDWDRELCQAKEKFGSGRFYINKGNPTIFERIVLWERLTMITCEFCGAPGKRREMNWIKTLCDTCYANRKK